MGKCKSFVFPRPVQELLLSKDYRSAAQKLIKTAVGIVMHDFVDLKTMTFHHVADIAYF